MSKHTQRLKLVVVDQPSFVCGDLVRLRSQHGRGVIGVVLGMRDRDTKVAVRWRGVCWSYVMTHKPSDLITVAQNNAKH